MRKSIITLLLVCMVAVGWAQVPMRSGSQPGSNGLGNEQLNLSKISPELRDSIAESTDATALYRIIITMDENYSQAQMTRQTQFMSKTEKREFVVNALQRFSAASQHDVLELLNEGSRANIVSNVQSHWLFNGITCKANADIIYAVANDRRVSGIYMDHMVYRLPEDWDNSEPLLEPIRGNAWNVEKVNADDVWNLGYTGAGVLVAVIDSGVRYNHNDIANNMWDGGAEYPNHGYDFVNDDNDPMDDHGHGTHCAGTISSYGASGTQCGIAKNAKIMALKVLASNGYGSSAYTWTAEEFAVSHGADILSMSLGAAGIGPYDVERQILVNVLNCGVVASIAAGNEGQKLTDYPVPSNIGSPGNCPSPWGNPDQTNILDGGHSACVAIGATTNTDEHSSFSSYGPATWTGGDYNNSFSDYPYTEGSSTEIGLIKPDVSAPGSSITSLNYASAMAYSTMSGTSMATPCVAGIMALMLEVDPTLTPVEIDSILEVTAVQLGGYTSKNNTFGAGRVDALAAVNAILNACNPPTALTATANGCTVDLSWTAASGVSSYRVYRNGIVIASTVSGTTYTDNQAPAGHNSYYVRSNCNSGNTSESSNIITVDIDMNAQIPAPTNLTATVNGNEINLAWDAPTQRNSTISYTTIGNSATGSNSDTYYFAQRYPVDMLMPYAGMQINSVYCYLYTENTSYTLTLYKGDAMLPGEVLCSCSFTTSEVGMYGIPLTPPVVIDPTDDLWLVISGVGLMVYNNNVEGCTDGFYYTFGDYDFFLSAEGRAWTMFLDVADAAYTYDVYRDSGSGSQRIAQGIDALTYVDTPNRPVTLTYDVRAVSNGYTSMPSNEASVTVIVPGETFDITLACGNYHGSFSADKTSAEAGETVTLSTNPDTNHQFTGWLVFKTGEPSTTVAVVNNQFTMPAYDVTVSAQFGTNASNVTIGGENSPFNYLPTYGLYKYSLSQQIYLASEVGGAGTITAIAFNNSAYSMTRNLDIYLKHTSKDAFSSQTDWESVTTSEKVFSGEVTFAATGWTAITLDTPFAYDGTSNLLLCVDDNSGQWASSYPIFYAYPTTNRALYCCRDSSDYDPAEIGSLSGTIGNCNNQLYIDKEGFYNSGTIAVTPCSLSDFTYVAGFGPSASQQLNLAGSHLYEYITVTAPANFEICATENGTYSSSLSLTPSGSTLYVRMAAGCTIGDYSGNLTLSSGTATTTVALSGSVSVNLQPFNIYIATGDYHGTISADKSSAICGETVTLTAIPDADYRFDRWLVCKTDDPSVTIDVTDNQFTMPAFDVIVSAEFVDAAYNDITIGDGTDSYPHTPTYVYYNYSLTQQIYTASEIGRAGIITSISFYYTGNETTRSLDVYLSPTTLDNFAGYIAENWQTVSSSNMVFSGSVTFVPNDWTTITFSTPYVYNGTSNLLVTVNDNTGSCIMNNQNFLCTSTTNYTCLYYYNDNIDLDPTGTISTNASGRLHAHNNIKLTFFDYDGITIGDGAYNSACTPTYVYYNYSLTQQIYTASEIGRAGTITGINFYYTGESTTRWLDVYLSPTTLDNFAGLTADNWQTVSSSNKVFSGQVFLVSNGWTAITFTTPFSYDGANNLLVTVDDNTGGWTKNGQYFLCTSTSNYTCLYYYNDSTNPDPTGTISTTASGRLQAHNNIKLTFFNCPHDISISCNNPYGTVSSDTYSAMPGETVTLSATPDHGYSISSYVAFMTDNPAIQVHVNGNTFTMPDFDVTVSAIFISNLSGINVGENGTYSELNYAPIHMYYNYSLTQSIYTPEQLENQACTISAIAYYYTSTAAEQRSIDIYMTTTNTNSFENTASWIQQDANNQVFSGTFSVDATEGWKYITLDKPFDYNGTDNLLVTVDDHTGTCSSSTRFFRSFDTETKTTIFYYSDGTHIDPTNLTETARGVAAESPVMYLKTLPLSNELVVVTPCELDGFTYREDEGPSASQRLQFTASDLVEDITLHAPTHFEVSSTENGEYSSTFTFNPI